MVTQMNMSQLYLEVFIGAIEIADNKNKFTVSHQWCDLFFYRLLHSYKRHIERVVRGERYTFLSAQE